MTGFLLVCLGAGVGAPGRYLLDRAIQSRHTTLVPWGTLTINLSGSFLLGVLYGSEVNSDVLLLVGTGFCGAFTTYGTFAFESVRLVEEGAIWGAFGNISVSVLGGLGAAMLGIAVATAS